MSEPIIKEPRKYQEKGLQDFYQALHRGVRKVCLVAPTGAGKTIIKAFASQYYVRGKHPNADMNKLVVIFAHRDVLLEQISLAVGKVGLKHQLLCSKSTERQIGNLHIEQLGNSYIDDTHRSRVIVASVPTWNRRDTSHINDKVGLWLMDETHHVLADNQWGKCVNQFTNAVGLGVTATPLRADGKGLGADNDGVFEELVECPDMGELIKIGALSPYRIYHIPDRVDVSNVKVTSGGDYNQNQLAAVTDVPDITGDAVQHYKRISDGKQAIVFAVNIAHSDHVAAEFKAHGINAISLSSKTNITERQRQISLFKNGITKVLINCDLFGEGFDVPAVETVIMLRKTKSYGLFMQMFGRMLRPFEGKSHGILIDHVGNVREHCATRRPHESPEWTLDRPNKRKGSVSDEEAIFTRICPECFGEYIPESKLPKDFICPYCSHLETQDEINDKQKELVVADGQLVEYDTSYLDDIIKERNKVDRDVSVVTQGMAYTGASKMVISSVSKNHLARQESQRVLRSWINSWCYHIELQYGYSIDVVRAEFARIFKKNVFEATVLSATEADKLTEKIKANWSNHITIKKII